MLMLRLVQGLRKISASSGFALGVRVFGVCLGFRVSRFYDLGVCRLARAGLGPEPRQRKSNSCIDAAKSHLSHSGSSCPKP